MYYSHCHSFCIDPEVSTRKTTSAVPPTPVVAVGVTVTNSVDSSPGAMIKSKISGASFAARTINFDESIDFEIEASLKIVSGESPTMLGRPSLPCMKTYDPGPRTLAA